MEKLDLLAFAAHPDDAELGCGGTLLHHISLGKKAGIADLTRGELGTRGTAETRDAEAAEASKILGLHVRENLGMDDGFFANDKAHQLKIIQCIRRYRPDIVLANALSDRHTDHGRAGQLVADAAFLSGLMKIETSDGGKPQQAWRPRLVLHYIQDYIIVPDIVVDITAHQEQKMKAVKAYKTQFFSKSSKEPVTPISVEHFLDYIEGRAMDIGRFSGVKYGEGFNKSRPLGLNDLTQLY